MEKHTASARPAAPFTPLAGWEAATRWNAASIGWMARGWQQWMALVTTVPKAFVLPVAGEKNAGALGSRLRGNDEEMKTRAVANGEPARAARPARAAAKARSTQSTKKKRSRG